MMKKCKVQINHGIPGYEKGQIITIMCDKKGIPTDRYWFRRYRDSKIDNCITVLEKEKLAKTPKLPAKSQEGKK